MNDLKTNPVGGNGKVETEPNPNDFKPKYADGMHATICGGQAPSVVKTTQSASSDTDDKG